MDYLPANFPNFSIPQNVASPFLAAQPFVSLYNVLSDIEHGLWDRILLFIFLVFATLYINLLMTNEPHVIPYSAFLTGHDQASIIRARAREIRPITKKLWLGFYVVYLVYLLMQAYLVIPAYSTYVWSLMVYPAPTWGQAAMKWITIVWGYWLWGFLGAFMGTFSIVNTFLGTRELALGGRRDGEMEGKCGEKEKGAKMV